jgi:hypothetical protein
MTGVSISRVALATLLGAAIAASAASSASQQTNGVKGKAAAAYTLRIGHMTIPRSWLLLADRPAAADPPGMIVGSYTVRVGDMTIPKTWLGIH